MGGVVIDTSLCEQWMMRYAVRPSIQLNRGVRAGAGGEHLDPPVPARIPMAVEGPTSGHVLMQLCGRRGQSAPLEAGTRADETAVESAAAI